MKTLKDRTGECRICGEIKTLTFEHVPPRSAFNKNTRYISTTLEEYSKIDNHLTTRSKGKIEQGGMGFYSLCKACNNYLGREYVKAYEHWALSGLEIISNGEFNHIDYLVRNQEPLKIIKQVISMFLSLNEPWFRNEFSELVQFVRDPHSQVLPERYRLFAYLNKEGQMRYSSFMTIYSPHLPGANVCEIAFPPFGYLLTIDYSNEVPLLTEITGFKNHDENEPVTIRLSFNVLPTYLAFPYDYRTKKQIEIDIENGILAKQKIENQYDG